MPNLDKIKLFVENKINCKITFLPYVENDKIINFTFQKNGAGWVDINTQQVFFTKNVKNYKKLK